MNTKQETGERGVRLPATESGEEMSDVLRVGIGRHLLPVPGWLWRRRVAQQASSVTRALTFMTADHHRVRDFVVAEITRTGAPVSPGAISTQVGMGLAQTGVILDQLESRNFFLVRNASGWVDWAYPVTAAETPHRLHYRSGETLYAA